MPDHRRRRRGAPRPPQDDLLPAAYSPADSSAGAEIGGPDDGGWDAGAAVEPEDAPAGSWDAGAWDAGADAGAWDAGADAGAWDAGASNADAVAGAVNLPGAGGPLAGSDLPARSGRPGFDDLRSGDGGFDDGGFEQGGFDDGGFEGGGTGDDQGVYAAANAGPAGGVYISYLDEGEVDDDGTAVATAVFVDEHGYAADGSYIGPAVYVDEDGHADDGTYVALDPTTDELGLADQGVYGGVPYDDDMDGPDDGRRRGGRRRRRHPILGVFVVVLAMLILIAGAGILWAVHEANPGGHVGRKVAVTIKKGESTAAIGRQLTSAGIIHGGGTLFRYYVRLEGDGPLYPGTYHLATNETFDHVITRLETPPKTFVDKLVIPEGFTLTEIAARVASLRGMHFKASAFLALSRRGSVTSPFEPPGVHNLEGLLYPATYKVVQGTSETALLSTLEGDFVNEADEVGLKAAAAKLHMTPYQVVTVASIIQGEAKFASDGPDTASVIYNRLKQNIALGADSTLLYALRRAHPNLDVSKVNFEEPSRYNTRLHKGLPPSPIDNPSAIFLKDAMYPPHTSYLYFVEVQKDGKLGFAKTAAGFNQLKTECRAHGLC